jgi:hypothetical protein
MGDSDPLPAQVDVKSALCSCLLGAWRGSPPLGGSGCLDVTAPVVPIAHVFWSRFALDEESSQILNVDNCSLRPLAPGGPAIRALVESLTGSATPATLAPRVFILDPPNGAVITQSQTASNFKIRATFDAILSNAVTPGNAYELVFYPQFSAVPVVFAGTVGPATSVVDPQFITPSEGITALELTFTGVDSPGFDLGTYVFRLKNGGTAAIPQAGTELRSEATDAQLDGEPNPPAAVPSGNGLSGGPFEARFVVTSG